MTPEILDRCTAGAFDGSVSFPETIKRAIADGVEWYLANLILGVKTYYGDDLSHHQTSWPNWNTPKIAGIFSPKKVKEAIRASQDGRITYQEFLKLAADAGVTYYTVHLRGRKAVYFGRDGDSFIEPFPS